MTCKSIITTSHSFMPAPIPPKENSGASGGFLPKHLLLRLRLPNSKTNQPKFWQILSPKNSFAKTSSALKPRHTARILGGQNPKKKNVLSILEKITPAKIRKSKEHFFFLGLPSEARRWRGFLRAYDLVSSHHALRAWHISDFGNRCELGTIETPEQNLAAFSKPNGGTREARPTDFLPFSQTNSDSRLRRGGMVFCQGAGGKSECNFDIVFALIQKEFLLL